MLTGGGSIPQGMCLSKTRYRGAEVSEQEQQKQGPEGGKDTYMSKQVFPQAPSPTITNLRLISAIAVVRRELVVSDV